ncbi:7-methylguanosine phosphate-specific 5'-nucleotidase-like [Aphomia sociella]
MVISSLNDMPELKKENVIIQNEKNVLEKINKMISQTYKKLHIVADFDYTLTKPFDDKGGKIPTSFDLFTACPSVPDKYKKEHKDLENIYLPIEIDGKISDDEKSESMSQWFEKVYALIKSDIEVFPSKELLELADKSYFRSGVEDLVNWCEEKQVPVLVFSAGMGEAVKALMEKANFLRENVKIVANLCALDDNGKVIGLEDNFLIHTHNKREAIEKKNIGEMQSVLLMGDNAKDASMVRDDCETVIKIGFLSRNIENNKEEFLKTFDIVLVSDITMDVPNALLRLL